MHKQSHHAGSEGITNNPLDSQAYDRRMTGDVRTGNPVRMSVCTTSGSSVVSREEAVLTDKLYFIQLLSSAKSDDQVRTTAIFAGNTDEQHHLRNISRIGSVIDKKFEEMFLKRSC
jgi:hypothetical protein